MDRSHFQTARWCSVLLFAAGCATARLDQEPELREPVDTPPQFVTEDGVAAEDRCRNALIDPRDQTRLRLIRSVPMGTLQRGDYDVPRGRYGVGESELLRIDCATGQPIGIVRS